MALVGNQKEANSFAGGGEAGLAAQLAVLPAELIVEVARLPACIVELDTRYNVIIHISREVFGPCSKRRVCVCVWL